MNLFQVRHRRREGTVSSVGSCKENETDSSKDKGEPKALRHILLAILTFLGFVASITFVLQKKDALPIDAYSVGQEVVLESQSEKQSSVELSINTIYDMDPKDSEDISWLNRIQLGEWLGSGDYSDTFAATVDGAPTDKSYIIKFTGDYKKKKYAKKSIVGAEAVRRLSPHPNIPENLYFVARTTNPFRTKQFTLPSEADKRKSTGIRSMGIERLDKSHYVSITVSERVTQTLKHMRGSELDIPASKIRCFFYHLFDVMDYAHSKGVMMIDTKLWNVVLENGVMKFLDWNRADLVETKEERRMRELRNEPQPPYVCSQGVDKDCDAVHDYDVWRLALKRLTELLDDDSKKRARGSENIMSPRDRNLFKDMRDVMLNDDPRPTLRWILDNHEYFTVEDSSNCTLIW